MKVSLVTTHDSDGVSVEAFASLDYALEFAEAEVVRLSLKGTQAWTRQSFPSTDSRRFHAEGRDTGWSVSVDEQDVRAKSFRWVAARIHRARAR